MAVMMTLHNKIYLVWSRIIGLSLALLHRGFLDCCRKAQGTKDLRLTEQSLLLFPSPGKTTKEVFSEEKDIAL